MIEPTAVPEYRTQGAGIGDEGRTALTVCPIEGAHRHIIELGFGQGVLLRRLANEGHCAVGIDIADKATTHYLEAGEPWGASGYAVPLRMDLSHNPIPFTDDFFHYAFCSETIEHLSNPYFMMAEMKRVLADGGKCCIAFPMPESSLGYGNGKHAHVYPGFLTRDSFERFMVQLYFRKINRVENGSSAWYVYENVKRGEQMDVFKVVSGNPDGEQIYADVKGDVDCSA